MKLLPACLALLAVSGCRAAREDVSRPRLATASGLDHVRILSKGLE
jgi:hypothetical protein